MAHWKELFSGGNYLAGADFKGKTFTAKIAKVESTSMEDDAGKTKSLPIVTWDIKAKPWLMCKTTCYCLAAMYGTDPAMWVGKRVTLYATMVQVGKGQELGVRVKGSPDLPVPIDVEIKLPRKKPFTVKLSNTTTRGPAAATNGKATEPVAPVETPPPAEEPAPELEPGSDG
jgi:hypothetical protein